MNRLSSRARRSLGAISAAVLLSTTNRGIAQTPAQGSARAAADSFFALVAREKWDSAAAMIDLKRFEPYFKTVVSNTRGAIPQRPMTVEDLMANDSTMPRAVAEWQISQMKKAGADEQFGYLSYEFAGVTTPRDLFALTIPAAAARWLEAQDGRTQMRESWRRQGCAMSDLPAFPPAKHTVLATALVDDSTAYIVHTDDRFGSETPYGISGERVMKLHRVNHRWLIEAREDLLRPAGTSFGGFGFECPNARRPR